MYYRGPGFLAFLYDEGEGAKSYDCEKDWPSKIH